MFHEWFALMYWQGTMRGLRLGLRHLGRRLLQVNRPSGAESVFPESTSGPASLSPAGGVPVMHLYGAPAQMGRQHGELLGPAVRRVQKDYIEHVFGDAASRAAGIAGGRRLVAHCPRGYSDELNALSEAAGVERDAVVVQQTFTDTSKIVLCTAFGVEGARTACGRPMMGRNLDFPSFGVADRYSLVAVFHPDSGRAFASVTWPGMFGVLSGMNDAGLSAATMQVFAAGENFDGMPSALLYREVLNKCSTTAQARDFLSSSRIAGTNNLMIMDASGAATVAELSPAGVHFRRPDEAGLFAANHFHARPHRQSSWWCPRTFRLKRAFAEPRRWRLSDVLRLLHGVNQGWLTLQSMVFLPSERRLLVSLGKPPTTRRRYSELDLAAEFARPPA